MDQKLNKTSRKISIKKLALLIVIVALLALAGLVYFKSQSDDQKSASQQKNTEENQILLQRACEIFDIENAKKIFGNDTYDDPANYVDNKKSTEIQAKNAELNPSQKDIKISSCSYLSESQRDNVDASSGSENKSEPVSKDSTEANADISKVLDEVKRATEKVNPNSSKVLITLTINESSDEDSVKMFESIASKDKSDVPNIGSKAYFDQAALVQNNPLENRLVVLEGDKVITISAEDITLEQARDVAEIVLKNLRGE